MTSLEQRLAALTGDRLRGMRRGIEKESLRAQPDGYIAQPTLSLSTVPILVKKGIAPRHVDFRPFVLTGAKLAVSYALIGVIAANWGQNVTVFLFAAVAALIVAGTLVLLLPRMRRGL